MSDLDFYNYFQQQTQQAYGDITSYYPTVPVPPLSQTPEEIIKESGARTTPTANSNSAMAPMTASVSKPTTVSLSDEPEVEQYSHWAPTGSVPDGYKAAECCATCEYFECGYCAKYDFPCHAAYVCEKYESLIEEEGEEKGEVYFEGSLLLDVAALTEDEIEILAEGWTDKGNVKSSTRKKKAVLSEGRFPVFDKKSALSALKLRGRAKNAKERNRIIRAAARYAPEEAKKARETDRQALTDVVEPTRVPSRPALFALALSSADATENDLESAYGIYTELYTVRYGTTEGLFLTEPTKQVLAEVATLDKPSLEEKSTLEESLEEDSSSTPELPADTAESESIEKETPFLLNYKQDPLYQVAENRIFLRARQLQKNAADSEILSEYKRLVSLRGT